MHARAQGYKPWLTTPKPAKHDIQKHTIWQDERALLKAVEDRLQRRVERMGAGMELPAGLAGAVGGSAEGGGADGAGGTTVAGAAASTIEEMLNS